MGFNSTFKGLQNTKNSCVLTETKPNTLSSGNELILEKLL